MTCRSLRSPQRHPVMRGRSRDSARPVWTSVSIVAISLATSCRPEGSTVPKSIGAPPTGMVLVPAGRFQPGGEMSQNPFLTVTSLFIDETEVTVSAYAACVQAGRCDALSVNAVPMRDEAGAVTGVVAVLAVRAPRTRAGRFTAGSARSGTTARTSPFALIVSISDCDMRVAKPLISSNDRTSRALVACSSETRCACEALMTDARTAEAARLGSSAVNCSRIRTIMSRSGMTAGVAAEPTDADGQDEGGGCAALPGPLHATPIVARTPRERMP